MLILHSGETTVLKFLQCMMMFRVFCKLVCTQVYRLRQSPDVLYVIRKYAKILQ